MRGTGNPGRPSAVLVGEAAKEMQKQQRAMKQERRLAMDARHFFIVEKLAQTTDIDQSSIEDFVLADSKYHLMDDFINGPSKKLLFCLEEAESEASQPHKNLFLVDGGMEINKTTLCLLFLKNSCNGLKSANLDKDLNFMYFHSPPGSIMEGLHDFIARVWLPFLKSDKATNEFSLNHQKKILSFVENVEDFTNKITKCKSSVLTFTYLDTTPLSLVLDKLPPSEYRTKAQDADMVVELEKLLSRWMEQVEEMLIKSEQIRREEENFGPSAELTYCKSRMEQIDTLLDQLKSNHCRAVIHILLAAKSKLINKWRALDSLVTDSANEAKDNVKYLQTLSNVFNLLSKSNPVETLEILPSLIKNIGLAYCVSSYYNSNERLTSLFSKITNQLITSSKNHLMKGVDKIWDLSLDELKKRIEECIELNRFYRGQFRENKKLLENNSNVKHFDFSEHHIFGKFDAFTKRLQEIQSIIKLREDFAHLERIKLDGLESFVDKSKSIAEHVIKKSTDVLDYRQPQFSRDVEVFKNQYDALASGLDTFIEEWMDRPLSTLQHINLLKKFESFPPGYLNMDSKFSTLLEIYSNDIEDVKRLYEAQKENPPFSRNFPPTAGRISWCRQLLKRVDQPMHLFRTMPNIFKSDKGREVGKDYTHTVSVLVEYEYLFYRAWCKDINAVKMRLNSPLLCREDRLREIQVNLDSKILKVLSETKHLRKLNLEVPEFALTLSHVEGRLRRTKERLEEILNEYKKSLKEIPPPLSALFKEHVDKVEEALSPGLRNITWISVKIEDYLTNLSSALTETKRLLRVSLDTLKNRIEARLKGMSSPLELLPLNQPLTLDEFIKDTEAVLARKEKELSTSSGLIESAVKELVLLLNPSSEHVVEAQSQVMNEFALKCIDALTKCVKGTLEKLKQRLLSDKFSGERGITRCPVFVVELTLNKPQSKVIMLPGMEKLQGCINSLVNDAIKLAESIHQWNMVIPLETFDGFNDTSRSSLRSMSKLVTENQEISKSILHVSSIISSIRPDVNSFLSAFQRFKELWQETSQDEEINEESSVYELENRLKHFQKLQSMAADLPSSSSIGYLMFTCDSLKNTLIQSAKEKMRNCAQRHHLKCAKSIENISSFVENKMKLLEKPVNDLDDIRSHMATLADVREFEEGVEQTFVPVEETHAVFNRFSIHFNDGQAESFDGLLYHWNLLKEKVKLVQDHLIGVQHEFRGDLLEKIEIFRRQADIFVGDYHHRGPMTPGLEPREASNRLNIFQSQMDDLWRKYETYKDGEKLFGLPVTSYPELQKIMKDMTLLQKLYQLYNQVLDTIKGFGDIPWNEVDVEAIRSEMEEFQMRCNRLPTSLKSWKAFEGLKEMISNFNEFNSIVEGMAKNSLQSRHWNNISSLTGFTFDVENSNFLLKDVLSAPLLKYKIDIEDICLAATKEKEIEVKLTSVLIGWNEQEFAFSTFKSRGELLLKGDVTSEIINLLEDSLVVLGSLLNNRYNGPYKLKIQDWVSKLSTTSEAIEKWLVVQNLWMYLEAVFVGRDISKQLPQEAKRFSNIDKTWQNIMHKAHEFRNVVQCCTADGTLLQLLDHLHEQLEVCQKSLSGYLEKKRLIFPRFFFVSDPVLLEILGQASDPHTIQGHLLSIFDNTKRVRFDEKTYDKILALQSQEGEHVELMSPVFAHGNVEIWLGELLNATRATIHSLIRQAFAVISQPEFELLHFENSFPAQIGLLGLQIIWTFESEHALSFAKGDKRIMTATSNFFSALLSQLIQVTTKDLTSLERRKYETLITIHVHQKDIFEDLVRQNVKSAEDFEWLKQTRFYFKENDDKCQVSVTNVNFKYMNEYLGCTERLVITPLTDRCYITLAQALNMSLGGAPAGPAGTGKTETTKDMGRCLGKYVVVFNCSDQMDYRGLGRIFKGLAQSGSWGCFDEFNRIELPVLSVAAQQIATVLNCKKERRPQFVFTDSDIVDMDPEFGIFLTMNPGYAGRQELPENLKINFRTVAMMVPDRAIIIRVKLASCGFQQNLTLSKKFYNLYKLCEEQLSKQIHYDFGLRNILSVLRTLGAAKRNNPDDGEMATVMKVLNDMNISKLVDEDEPLFISLIEDLFPGMSCEKGNYAEVEEAIKDQVEKSALIHHPPWVLKMIQLYETQRVRHGIMVLGPSGAGKTTCIRTLAKALTQCGMPHKEMRMNPKAITSSQMFGQLDAATNDWTDGIFSTLWRKTQKMKKGDHTWLVLDGPVDAIWIENLNSVLDDNKTLTLANGDRISMAATCKIIFEVHNIDNASPATVSRNGMIYMSSSLLDWKTILKGYLKGSEADLMMSTFRRVWTSAYTYVVQHLNPKMDILECMYVKQAVELYQGLNLTLEDKSSDTLTKSIIFSLMWSLGALLECEDRRKLEMFLRNAESDLPLPPPSAEDTMFDFKLSQSGEWMHWREMIPAFNYPRDSIPDYSSILVPNVDNMRTEYLINLMASRGRQVLLIGEQGTAKTVMIQVYCNKYDKEHHLHKTFNFSSTTTPQTFQREIEGYLEKRVGSTYGPSAGRKMTIFLDDLNMPLVNEWGDQVTNEITRQLIEAEGFYSLDHPGEFSNVVDVQVLAAMIHPGGGRSDIPQRLKRHFSIFNCTLPSDASIDQIFSAIGCGYFIQERGFSSEIAGFIEHLVKATRVVWQTSKSKLLSTPTKFHYVFNLRDLSRIWQGILKSTKEVVKDSKDLLSLWRHECTRVIADRFIGVEDKIFFDDILKQVVESSFGSEAANRVKQESYFVDFLRDTLEADDADEGGVSFEAPKIYEPIASFDQLSDRLKMYLSQYNETVRGSKLDLVFFQDAMKNLAKISRIIGTRGGHALLVGVGGSGRQSLTKLASFIAGYKTFRITLTRAYNQGNLIEDLKYLHKTAGLQGKGITFIFTDNDVKNEFFLEFINALLSTGQISSLFPREEMDEIMQELVPIMKKEHPRRAPSNDNLFDYFVSRVKSNLHVVLCFSPVGDKFRSRTLKFPGLISGCTINWFERWPKEALTAVSKHFISDFDMICTPQVKNQVTEAMGIIHDEVASQCLEYFQRLRRHAHVTPKSFLSFLSTYKSLYESKHSQIEQLGNRMKAGVQKLVEATDAVNLLAEQLVEKEKELQVAKEKAEEVLRAVNLRSCEAEKIKDEVLKVKEEAEKLVEEINMDKAEAEIKLEEAQPMLIAAEDALKTIKPADIATVRKLGRPPHLVMRIMDCILLLFQRPLSTPMSFDAERQCVTPSWSEALKITAQTNFLQSVMNFPKDTINEETVELLQPYLTIDDGEAEQASKSIKGLLLWTRAMVGFYSVNKDVLPLKNNLAIQEAHHLVASKKLEDAEKVLADKQKDLESVQKEYYDAMKHNEALQRNADECRKKMVNAKALIEGLADEKVRWSESNDIYREQIHKLPGDVVVAAGFLSYAGPFNHEFRSMVQSSMTKELITRSIPFSSNMNLINMLVDNATTSQWGVQGLPSDELSIQNGLIVTKSTRYPLIIDPQGQGKAWIKKSNNHLQVTNLNHKYFRNHLEDCLSLGKPLLIEDVGEELDPMLDNVLEKNFFKQGSVMKVKVSDKEVDVMDGFMMFLSTKFANPSYSPEVSAKTSIINFTVTYEGLEDQLLGLVILTERKELESERTRLMEDVAENKNKLKSLEDNLLLRLASTQVSLVEDETLIKDLRVAKLTGKEVKEKLRTAADTEMRINSAREEFRPIATRGSVLYFLMVELNMVNHMYQTSLDQFLQMFKLSMAKAVKSPINCKRIHNILDCLTTLSHCQTTRGLYEKDKFLFPFLATLKIEKQSNRISDDEFNILIKGGAALDLNSVAPKPNKWLSDSIWLNLVELSKINPFTQILTQIAEHEKEWKHWFNSATPEETDLPCQYSTKLSTFHKLMLIRCFCIDRTIPMARTYVKEIMGEQYVDSPVLDMELMLNDSTPRTPLLCLLSMGSDPTENIEKLAKIKGLNCTAISMGQGQEVHARRVLNEFMMEGGWILLQNLHLALNYVDELFDNISDASRHIHHSFRLWITTEVHPKFSINLLQTSIKFTFEPPQGLKAGLKRTYGMISKDLLEANNMIQWRPLLFTLAFLHSVVQERKKFGPIGWSIPYEFNQTDFTSSVQFVQTHLDDLNSRKNISWNTIRYMIGEVQYGGRVTDERDKKLLNTFAKVWFREGIIDPSFQFANGYKIPACKNLEEYRIFVDHLSSVDDPEVFGLNCNANIIYQTNAANSLLETIINIQPKVSTGKANESRESVTHRVADDMLKKLPQNFIPFKVQERLKVMGQFDPLNIFLRQELKRMTRVISLVSSTLTDLKMAIEGTIVMSDELRDALDCIYDARTPSKWEKISWISSSIGFWFTELLNRHQQLDKWLFEKRPSVFWLAGFFNPQGFLTATKQEITRSHKGWALDDVILDSEVTSMLKEDVTSAPPEGVHIHGLHLNGAGWDKKNCRLSEASPKMLYVALPVVRIFATKVDKKSTEKKTSTANSYECPVYKRPQRTDLTYIFSLALKSIEPADHWTRRGVALICDIK